MNINRSSFYKWKRLINKPSDKDIKRQSDLKLFIDYHKKYPSHGYRWLNAKIRLDLGVVYTDNYAFKCCHYLGIKSRAKHAKGIINRYIRGTEVKEEKKYDNLLLEGLSPTAPNEVIVSDMTAFKVKGMYYELALYVDLYNNEIVTYSLTCVRGNREIYFNGLKDIIQKKKEYSNLNLVLHTDQGSVYSSKAYNDLLLINNITHSMSRPGTPTDNAAMESINGWFKEEIFIDFDIEDCQNVFQFIPEYIKFFNYKRPQYSLNYLTPFEYKQRYYEALKKS